MKGIFFMFGLIGILVMGMNRQNDLTRLRLITAQFQRVEEAQVAGYSPLPGPYQCFKNPNFGGLGYRYINTSLMDANVNFLQPEGLVYVSGPGGALQLAAVEYIVPVAAWNATHTGWPQLMGQQFHLNPVLEVYVLHVWVWADNPSGMFEDWNPNVSCP
jgi:hypothetical protein